MFGSEMDSLDRELLEFQTKDPVVSLFFRLRGHPFLWHAIRLWLLTGEEISDLSQGVYYEDLFVEPTVPGGFIAGLWVFGAEEFIIQVNGVVAQVGYPKNTMVLSLLDSKELRDDSDLERLKENDENIYCTCLNELGGVSVEAANVHPLKEVFTTGESSVFLGKDMGIGDTAPKVFEVMPLQNPGSGLALFSQGIISELIGIDSFTNQRTLGDNVNLRRIYVVPSLESKVCRDAWSGVSMVDCRALANKAGFTNTKKALMAGSSLNKHHMFDVMTERVFENSMDVDAIGLKTILVFDGSPQVESANVGWVYHGNCVTKCWECLCSISSWRDISVILVGYRTVDSTWVGYRGMQRSYSWLGFQPILLFGMCRIDLAFYGVLTEMIAYKLSTVTRVVTVSNAMVGNGFRGVVADVVHEAASYKLLCSCGQVYVTNHNL